jgi:hypothetical protein
MHLANQIGQHLRRKHGLAEEIVVAATLVQPDGSPVPQAQNRLVVSLVKIEKDSVPRPSPSLATESDGRLGTRAAPLHLSLHILLTANFGAGNYGEALKFLSGAIGFLQRTPIFDHGVSPDLPQGIERLVVDIENTSIQEQSNLWGMLGAKHAPSILYKVRMVTLGGSDLTGMQHGVSDGFPTLGSMERRP